MLALRPLRTCLSQSRSSKRFGAGNQADKIKKRMQSIMEVEAPRRERYAMVDIWLLNAFCQTIQTWRKPNSSKIYGLLMTNNMETEKIVMTGMRITIIDLLDLCLCHYWPFEWHRRLLWVQGQRAPQSQWQRAKMSSSPSIFPPFLQIATVNWAGIEI